MIQTGHDIICEHTLRGSLRAAQHNFERAQRHHRVDTAKERHPLAPDSVTWEHDPDGIIRTWIRLGKYLQEGRSFDTGLACSTYEDAYHAEIYCAWWVKTGVEPQHLGEEPRQPVVARA